MNLYFIRKKDLSFEIIKSSDYIINKNLFFKEINLKGDLSKYFNKLFILNENSNNPEIIYNNKYIYDIELLKSNLQKCIRRKHTNGALDTVNILIRQNIQQLLRRLPIIALEDSIIEFDDFIFLVWLMIANSSGYNLNQIDIDKILLIIQNISESNYRDYIDNDLDSDFEYDNINNLDANNNIIKFYYSIFLRLEYGTMKGDKRWLQNLANKWLNRLKKNSKIINKIKNNYEKLENYKFNENILLKDYLLESVDFHCHKNIFDEIKNKVGYYTNTDIKNAIWFLRSSINDKRKFISTNKKVEEFIKFYNLEQKKYSGTFDKIKNILDEISKDYWIKSIKKNNSLINYFKN